DGYVLEIAPGKSIPPQRYIFEEIIFVLEGSGSTAVWYEDNKKVTFEWQAGRLFSPPCNSWRQHFNASGQKPGRLLSVTTAPVLFNLFRDTDFILNNNHAFKSRFDADPDSFSGSGESYRGRRMQVWDTNFVSDVRTLPVHRWEERGPGAASVSI